jgi:hypothetical protein
MFAILRDYHIGSADLVNLKEGFFGGEGDWGRGFGQLGILQLPKGERNAVFCRKPPRQWARSPQRGDPTIGGACRKTGVLTHYKNSFFEGAKMVVFDGHETRMDIG